MEQSVNAAARTDADVMMDAPIATVTLAGEPVEIREARIEDDLAFRRLADRLAGVVIGAITDASRKVVEESKNNFEVAKEGDKSARLNAIVQIGETALAAAIIPTIMGDGMAVALAMLWAYAPYLDQERFEREATTDELEEAALTVIEIALPFIQSRLKKAMRMMKIVEGMGK